MSPRKSELPHAVVRPPNQIAEQDLARLQLAWGQPSEQELGWFLRQGIKLKALLWPSPMGCCRVRFNGHAFEPNARGVRAFTFATFDRDVIIDIAAWQPNSGRVASLRGQAFCLGDLDDLLNPAVYFDRGALRVHLAPLTWLRADREGIVILRPDLAYAYLRNVPRLTFATKAHAHRVWVSIQPPQPTVQFAVETPRELAA